MGREYARPKIGFRSTTYSKKHFFTQKHQKRLKQKSRRRIAAPIAAFPLN
ncbi:hypothetical protein BQ1740_4235 [Bacillus subtilis]|nr:hypothetical protein BQ1740_4235 [Bacillus subtilis]